jgi:hypothetical protein
MDFAMVLKTLTLAAAGLITFGAGAAVASSCSLGNWQSTGTDMGTQTREYAYTGSSFTSTRHSMPAPAAAGTDYTFHGGYDASDQVTGRFTVQFNGSNYCTSDFSMSDGVFEVGQSDSFTSLQSIFRANLAFDTSGNITDYTLSAHSFGAYGDVHVVQASSRTGDSASHQFQYIATHPASGFAMLAPEVARATTASLGTLTAVPLPGALSMALLGFLTLAGLRRKTRT